jgi:thermostable 8-oxoguanine DNA glycosylase
LDSVKHKLEELKRDAQCLEKPDFVWLSLVESFSSMGNSRGYEGLFGNPENYKKITFEALSCLSLEDRLRVLAETLSAAVVRMPDKKAEWLAAAFEQIARMGGPVEAKAKLLREPGRDAKIAFLRKFSGIGPKYARNIFMNVYHPEFRQCIAVDSRIESVLAKLDFNALKSYEEQEQFLLDVAETAGVDGWGLDRMIYHFKDEILGRLNGGS